ncbi:hypothetical protein FKW77_001029 [Venturia effusa]|uniref:Cyanovirin-N domain-containing protein n=1 Tax=Venturia effusa TaxID=50376 RepID=A0A517LPH0_9PEZI|nr:hypothetical protein FKW77_001029 [Venturia effusa]
MMPRLIAILSLLPLSLLASATSPKDGPCDFQTLSNLAFNTSLDNWKSTFASPSRPTCFEWCTDACTSSPDSYPRTMDGPKVSFKPACARHDFTYRNLKRLGMFNEVNKKMADDRLRDDMVMLCGKHEGCKGAARLLYYPAVRVVDRPVEEHNKWDEGEGKGHTKCIVFPGCCADHSDPSPCGRVQQTNFFLKFLHIGPESIGGSVEVSQGKDIVRGIRWNPKGERFTEAIMLAKMVKDQLTNYKNQGDRV